MFEDGTKITLANGMIDDISNLKVGSLIMCDDGSAARVMNVRKDLQTTYQLLQRTKHRAHIDINRAINPLHRIVYQRLDVRCSSGHALRLRVANKPTLEISVKTKSYFVKWRQLINIQTIDDRIIYIPKLQCKSFKLTPEGHYSAKNYLENLLKTIDNYLFYDIEVRDLSYIETRVRDSSMLVCSPVTKGNGLLSEYITGEKNLITADVLRMSWLLGLWLGDGTTSGPEISMDSHDTLLMEHLLLRTKTWNITPEYKDAPIPLRAKHVKLYHGDRVPGRKYRNYKTNNPFWKIINDLKFKDEMGTKQIPEFMYYEDVEIREAFLAGLIDSDGYVSEKDGQSFRVSIQTIYHSFMEGIVNIARSLGISATVTTRLPKQHVIEGRYVQCKFTYDCKLSGKSPLQNVLAYCGSTHKIREPPCVIKREPVYYSFSEEKRGLNWVYHIKVDGNQRFLLANKTIANSCSESCCKDQRPLLKPKNLKKCTACAAVGSRHYYKDWSGKGRICSRCYSRYKSNGYRCICCRFVPEARQVKRAKSEGSHSLTAPDGVIVTGPSCSRCQKGILIYDQNRGLSKKAHTSKEIMQT